MTPLIAADGCPALLRRSPGLRKVSSSSVPGSHNLFCHSPGREKARRVGDASGYRCFATESESLDHSSNRTARSKLEPSDDGPRTGGCRH
jgi:hypothetical protein